MNVTTEQKQDALKIICIYPEIHRQLENIEHELKQLSLRKDRLLEDLEKTRAEEIELIDSIKAQNPGVEFNTMELIQLL